MLSPLVDAIQKHVLAGDKLHADDTPIPVLAPGSGKTKTARLWTYVRDDRPAGEDIAPAVWFTYSEDRKGDHSRRHLTNFKGGRQTDAYAGFHHLYGDGAVYEVACWAHARRKFHEIHAIHASPTTTEALARIGALYGIEDEIRGKPAADHPISRIQELLPWNLATSLQTQSSQPLRHTHPVPTKKVVDTSRMTQEPGKRGAQGAQDAYAPARKYGN